MVLSLCNERVENENIPPICQSTKSGNIQNLTYSHLCKLAYRVSEVVYQKGLSGTRILIALEDPVDILITTIGCLSAGAVPVLFPYSQQTTHRQLTSIVLLSNAKYIFSEVKTGEIRDVHWLKITKAFKQNLQTSTLKIPESTHLLFYRFTPQNKGEVLSYSLNSLWENTKALTHRLGTQNFQPGTVSTFSPQTVEGFIMGFLLPIYTESTTWYFNQQSIEESPVDLLKIISLKSLKTSLCSLNTLILCEKNIQSEDIRELDLSCWKHVLLIETTPELSTLDSLKERLFATGFEANAFMPLYARRECGFALTARIPGTPLFKLHVNRHELCKGIVEIVPLSHPEGVSLQSKGLPLDKYEFIIARGKEKKTCNAFEVGEIYIKTPFISNGFYNNSKLNNQYFTKINGEKVLNTQHLGFKDNKGEIFITGDLQDIVEVNGNFINLKEFKNTLLEHCDALRQENLLLFKEEDNAEHQDSYLIIMLEQQGEDKDVKVIFDQIVEVACKDIELDWVKILIYETNTLPRVEKNLDIEPCIQVWQQGQLEPKHIWDLQEADEKYSDSKALINLYGLSDKRKAERFSAWLYSWVAYNKEIPEHELDIHKHLAYYGFSYIEVILLAHEINFVFDKWVPPSMLWEFINIKALGKFLFNEAFESERIELPLPQKQPDDVEWRSTPFENQIYDETAEYPLTGECQLFVVIDCHGNLDIPAWNRALNTLTHAHLNLRSCFEFRDNEVKRNTLDTLKNPAEFVDLLDFPEDEHQALIESIAVQTETEIFSSLETAPLWKCCIFRIHKKQHKIIFILHKTIVDTWSFEVFLRDLAQCYNTEINGYQSVLPKQNMSIADFANWIHHSRENDIFQKENCYWEKKLERADILYLPYDSDPNSFSTLPTDSITHKKIINN